MVGRTGRLQREDDILLCDFLDEKTEAWKVGSVQVVGQWFSWVRNPGLLPPIAAGLPRHGTAGCLSLGGGQEAHLYTG